MVLEMKVREDHIFTASNSESHQAIAAKEQMKYRMNLLITVNFVLLILCRTSCYITERACYHNQASCGEKQWSPRKNPKLSE
jgi:hypothetical protein